jgi:sensor c-di-GMP phosphodiesterase-like protein
MPFLTINQSAELLVHAWIKLYRHSPKLTVVVTLIVIATVVTAIGIAEKNAAEKREAERLKSQSYVTQAQLLDETRVNVKALLGFIENERRNLAASEEALLSLKREHELLKPLVESDRKTIDALFSAQEARNQAAQSTERWVGFGLGVVSSLVASFLWAVFAHMRSRQGNTRSTNFDVS